MVTILARLKALPGKEVDLAEACAQLAAEVVAREEGCLMYLPHVFTQDASEIVFFEKYKDEQAAEIHRNSDHFRAAGRKFKELLAGPPQVQILRQL